jgi:hypothetical protein
MTREHWISESEWPQLIEQIHAVQADMAEPAKLRFTDKNLAHLMVLIRLTIEFHHYLQSKRADTSDQGSFVRNYICDSILGGAESFQYVTDDYRGLTGASRSEIGLKNISVLSSFNESFFVSFNQFSVETNFEDRCRMLLDLFKMQIVFAGISYDWAADVR